MIAEVGHYNDNIIVTVEVISSRKRWMFLNLLLSLSLLLTLQLLNYDRWGWAYLIYAFWQFLVYGKLLYSELKTTGLNLLSLFFMGAIMTVALPSYSYAVGLIEGSKFYCLDAYEITDFVFRTAAAMNVYYSLFILLLTRFSNNRLFIVDIDYVAKKYNLFLIVIVLYVISFIFRIFPLLAIISSTLDQLAGSLPLLVVFVLAIYCGLSEKKDKYFWLFLVILFSEIACSFIFGMYKGTIIIYAFMYILYYYLHNRTVGRRIINTKSVFLGVFFLVFIIYIVYPFIIIKRNESGFGLNKDDSEIKEVDNVDIFMRVITFDYDMESIGGSDGGLGDAFIGRLSAVYANAFFYQDAYKNEFHSEMLKMSIKKMIPHIIWPDKPEGSDGNMTYSYMIGKEFNPLDVSANFIGLFAGAYFWGGWPGALLMCVINAWVLALLLKTCFSNLNNLFSWIILTMILVPMMRCFEESCDGGIRVDVSYLIYIIIIKITSPYFIKKVDNLGINDKELIKENDYNKNTV